MQRPQVTLAVLVFIAFCVILAPPTALGQPPHVDMDRLVSEIEAVLEREAIPGAAVVVISGGRAAMVRGFGTDGRGRPVTTRTGFRLGSMSKAFTALAVMRLVDKGSLDLDAPVRRRLPEFRLADPTAADAITLRHLLTHTSGIPARAPRASAGASLAGHVAALSSVRPVAAPGKQHVYASPNYLVAARLAEAVAGRPFEEILAAEVFRPLGIGHSRDAQESRLARGHRYWGVWPVPSGLATEPGRLATAGVIASAEDMAAFLLFQLGDGRRAGQRLVSAASMELMHRGQARGEGHSYAFGWREGRIAGTRAVHHGGILPDFRGKMVLLPDLDAAVAVLTNVSSGLPLPAQPISHRLADAIAAHLAGEPFRAPAPSERMVRAGVWTGLALILVAQVTTLWRLARRRDAGRRPRLAAAIEAGWILAVVFGLPVALGLTWPAIGTEMPDGVLWLSAMLVAGIGASALRWGKSFRR